MEIGHNEEANYGDNDTGEFNFLIRRNARSEIVGDFLIVDGNSGSSNKDDQAGDEPSKTKTPIHGFIIHHFVMNEKCLCL